MDNRFEIPVTWQEKEHLFPALLVTWGYTYRIEVEVFGMVLSFEPDEEGNFRGLLSQEDRQDNKKIDTGLLTAIAGQLVVLFRD